MTMTAERQGIKCGNCSDYHADIEEVKRCCRGELVSTATYPSRYNKDNEPTGYSYVGKYPGDDVSDSMLYLIGKLGGDKDVAKSYTKYEASRYIYDLQNEKKEAAPVAPAIPNEARESYTSQRTTFGVPVEFILTCPDGRYGVQLDETTPYKFIKVDRPKKGKYAGYLKIMSLHSETWKLVATVRLSDRKVWIENLTYVPEVRMACVDPETCKSAFAEKLGKCSDCGKPLTDPRSRWYGIGPDCEKDNPFRIDWVEQHGKGVYDPNDQQ